MNEHMSINATHPIVVSVIIDGREVRAEIDSIIYDREDMKPDYLKTKPPGHTPVIVRIASGDLAGQLIRVKANAIVYPPTNAARDAEGATRAGA